MKVLMVLSGASYWTLSDGSKDPSGYWAEEFVVPHQVFAGAGHHVQIAAPIGGNPTADPRSLEVEVAGDEAPAYAQYIAAHQDEIKRFLPLPEVSVSDFDVLFLPGGHGPMEDLAQDPDMGRILTEFNSAGKIIAPLCHGPAALLSASNAGGGWLFAGRKLTVFTDEEERLNGTADLAPWLVETVLKARGASVDSAASPWASHVVVDGNLISGQNPASSRALAEKVLGVLSA